VLWLCCATGERERDARELPITNPNFQARGVEIHVVGNLGVGVDNAQECVCWVEEGGSVRSWMMYFNLRSIEAW
jgi:hypothetical protein